VKDKRDTFYIRIRQYEHPVSMDTYRAKVAVCLAQAVETMFLYGDVMLLAGAEVHSAEDREVHE
jgi:hypothetical protein